MGKQKYKPKLFLCPNCNRATYGRTNDYICEDCFASIHFKYRVGEEVANPTLMDDIEMGGYSWEE